LGLLSPPYPLSFSGIRAQEKKERQDETQFTTKIDGFVTPPPPPHPQISSSPCMQQSSLTMSMSFLANLLNFK